MMLVNVDRTEKTISLVSIPRDTLIYCEYSVPKINSAYGWAGGGEQGMQELLLRVSEIIGFTPDGYIVVDLSIFRQLVDLMGGVTFDVRSTMHYSDPTQNLSIDLQAGKQHLNGEPGHAGRALPLRLRHGRPRPHRGAAFARLRRHPPVGLAEGRHPPAAGREARCRPYQHRSFHPQPPLAGRELPALQPQRDQLRHAPRATPRISPAARITCWTPRASRISSINI